MGLAHRGDELQLTGRRQEAAGYVWVEVYLPTGGGFAWVAEQYLR